MNIASLQTMVGKNLKIPSNVVQSGQSSKGTFGSVFGSITANNAIVKVPTMDEPVPMVSDESLKTLFNATTLEELTAIINDEDGELEELNNLLGGFPKLDSVDQLAQLLDSLSLLLEKAGLRETELLDTPDFWAIMHAIDKVAPQFFNELSDALEGKGEIPKQQAIELLTLLKAGELIAPKNDLHLKQEQQVFTLQSYMAKTAVHHETNMHEKDSVKPAIIQLLGTKNAVRFVVQPNTDQSMKDDGTTGKTSDIVQQAVNSVVGAGTKMNGHLTSTELENRNNARNEALLREMQTIFKRSNFGQTGGTNRLLVKLYPEHLGQVRIELLQTNGIMTARILASTTLGKEMLDSQLHQLRQAFVQQNLQIDRIDISQSLQDMEKNDREQPYNGHFGRQQQETEQQHEQNTDDEMTFQEYLIELEV